MRTIKFRGKRLNGKEWVVGQLAYFFDNQNNACIMPNCYYGTRDFGETDDKGNPKIEDEIALGGFVNVHHDTIGQFTGLTDKNGVEIYEGDIVEVNKEHQPFGSWGRHSVHYIEQKGGFHLIGTTYDNMREAITDIAGKNCAEVIGNIHLQ